MLRSLVGSEMCIRDSLRLIGKRDNDNDLSPTANCAQSCEGGFLHNSCYTAGVTAMRKGSSGFKWSSLPTSNKQLDWATLLLTC